MAWERDDSIRRDNGEIVSGMAPYIISASRSTDIPAFYSEWFFNRLEKGYCAWINPFNQKKYFVSFKNTKFIVFWSKNPKKLILYLPRLKEKNIGCYVQFSLNDYVQERLERSVPPVEERIETFKILVKELGKGAVVWRYDPLVLTDTISVQDLLKKIERIGDALKGYTEKLVFSFADIEEYAKVKKNLRERGVPYKLWTPDLMRDFASGLQKLNEDKKWGYELATCAEKIDLSEFSISHNHCVDENLIVRLKSDDSDLLKFMGFKKEPETQPTLFDDEPLLDLFSNNSAEEQKVIPIVSVSGRFTKKIKDKGQREECGCIVSKDIGQYDTCPHQCEYCYANTSIKQAKENYHRYLTNKNGETILGE